MKKRMFIKFVLVFIVLIVAGVIVVIAVLVFRGEDRLLQTFMTQTGYVIDLRVPYEWEISRPIYAQVRKGKTILHRRVIGYPRARLSELRFQLIETNDGLAVIIERSNPHIVLLIFDTTSQQWWARTGGINEDVVKEEFFRRLNATNPSPLFIPSDEVQSNDYSIKVLP